jgi:hypothetical protein
VPSNCLNCGEPLQGNFCSNCGQRVDDRRAPLRSLLGEFFSEFFSLDGRNARTFVALLVPGKLTNLYFDGKRASYAPPIRVYFVASLLFFLLVGLPTLDASKYNVQVSGALVGRDQPDPELGYLDLGIASSSFVEEKAAQLREMDAQAFLDFFFGGLERTVPTALICFVPLLALALKLLHFRQRFFYVDHLIFAIHLQSFLFLSLVLARYLNMAGVDRLWAGPITYIAVFFLLPPPYMFFALRRVYRQSWLRTGLKWAAVGVLYLILFQVVLGVTIGFVLRQL